MIRGLLVDLDNTLVTIDVDAFVTEYSTAMARAIRPSDSERGLAAMTGATYRLLTEGGAGVTNRERLLTALSGELDETQEELWRRIEAASATVLPSLQGMASPVAGALATLREARRRGLRLALATNPIYPRSVIVERMAWAGVAPADVDVVACLEQCRSTKPYPAYFEELAASLGLAPSECLMVGDDPDQDLPARQTGMPVHLVGGEGAANVGPGVRAGPLGSLFAVWDDRLESFTA